MGILVSPVALVCLVNVNAWFSQSCLSPSLSFVLDEATNALDVDTEKQIFEQLESVRKYGAIIVVSHRPSTLKYCDRVFSLDQGKLQLLKPDNAHLHIRSQY